MSNQVLFAVGQIPAWVLLVIMYIVDTSRNLQQDEVGAVQALSLHEGLWPDLLTINLLHVSCITIYSQVWTGWCEDTQADSKRVKRRFCDSLFIHITCTVPICRSDLSANWIICQGIMARKWRMIRVPSNTSTFIGAFPQQVFKRENLSTSRYLALEMPQFIGESYL